MYRNVASDTISRYTAQIRGLQTRITESEAALSNYQKDNQTRLEKMKRVSSMSSPETGKIGGGKERFNELATENHLLMTRLEQSMAAQEALQ